MQVTKLLDLKKVIGELIQAESNKNFPKTIIFNRGIEFQKYKLTIEQIEDDYFIDSKGQKWAKVKDESLDDDDK